MNIINAGIIVALLITIVLFFDRPETIDTSNSFGGVTKEVTLPGESVEKEHVYYDSNDVKRKAVAFMDDGMQGIAYYSDDGTIVTKEYYYPGQDVIDKNIITYDDEGKRDIIITIFSNKSKIKYNISKLTWRKDEKNNPNSFILYDDENTQIPISQYKNEDRQRWNELRKVLKNFKKTYN